MIQTETAYQEALEWAEECFDVIDRTISELIDLVIAYEVAYYPIEGVDE